MSTEEEYGIPPGSVSCGYCEQQVATDEHIRECARRVESMRHYMMTVRLDAARKIRDWLAMRAVGGLYNLAMGVGELMGMDDAALRRIVEAGE